MALPTEQRAADMARRKELKRQICELIDDAKNVTVDGLPVLRMCCGRIGNGFSSREPEPGRVQLSLMIETGTKHPQFKRCGKDEYELTGFDG